jgi:hypothetical protein
MQSNITRVIAPLSISILFLLTPLLASAASACSTAPANFYVAPGGNDSGACTSISGSGACASLAGAIGKASPGQIIQIEPGTYTEYFATTKAGTFGAHYTMRGDPAYTRGSMVVSGSWGVEVDGSYWDVCHFRSTAGLGFGFSSNGSHYVTFDDVEADHNYKTGVRFSGGSDHGIVQNSYIHDDNQENVNGCATTNSCGGNSCPSLARWDNGIGIMDSTNATVQNNLVENEWGEGIDVFNSGTTPGNLSNTVIEVHK